MQPSEAKGIKILVVDDHPVVRKGLIFCLCRCDGLVLVGEAADGKEALQRARELHSEVILMDIDLPQVNGLAVTEELRRELPGIKVLVLSVHTESEYVLRAIRAGARGFISKHASVEELHAAILKVHAGETAFSPEVARVALNQFVRGNGLLKTGVCQITNRHTRTVVESEFGNSIAADPDTTLQVCETTDIDAGGDTPN